nr:hypothetical protein [Gemmobacter aquarius]
MVHLGRYFFGRGEKLGEVALPPGGVGLVVWPVASDGGPRKHSLKTHANLAGGFVLLRPYGLQDPKHVLGRNLVHGHVADVGHHVGRERCPEILDGLLVPDLRAFRFDPSIKSIVHLQTTALRGRQSGPSSAPSFYSVDT